MCRILFRRRLTPECEHSPWVEMISQAMPPRNGHERNLEAATRSELFSAVSMWIRLGSFMVAAGKLEELRATYYRDCAPVVRAQAGNVDCYLMENADDRERCIVCTIWENEAAAVAY